MVWDTNLSISKLPNNIAEYFKKEADVLYSDLLSKKLRVVLVPAPRSFFEGHKIRAVECQNPGWYSELYHLYAHFKRSRCANALDRIRTGEDKNYRVHPFRYDARVRELILTRLIEGYDLEGHNVPANQEVKKYFNGSIDNVVGVD